MKSMRSSLMNSPKVYSLEFPSVLVTTSVAREPCGVRTSKCALKTTSCPGDLNGDLVVGTGDLLLLLMDYGFGCE